MTKIQTLVSVLFVLTAFFAVVLSFAMSGQ